MKFNTNYLTRGIMLIKYSIFIFKYFQTPLRLVLKQIQNKEIQEWKLRNGGTFSTFGYGSLVYGLYRIWEEEEYGISINEISKYNLVVDIGAHVGLFSVFLGFLNPECCVLSFEMDETNFNNLKTNIKNCQTKNVIPFNCAISDKTQIVDYYGGRDSSEFSLKKLSFSESLPEINNNLNPKSKVQSITLNDIIESNEINSVDFLKMDCEGAEFEILFSTNDENLRKINKIGGEYHEFSYDGKEYKMHHLSKFLSKFGSTKYKKITDGIGLFEYKKE